MDKSILKFREKINAQESRKRMKKKNGRTYTIESL